MPLEPGRYAVRRDLAEIAVADRVFAPHYVVPEAQVAKSVTTIRARPRVDSEACAELAPGDTFHVVDCGNDWAWGRGDALGSVGYVDARCLAKIEP